MDRNELGSIEIQNAVFWYNLNKDAFCVTELGHESDKPEATASTGACNAGWSSKSEKDLIDQVVGIAMQSIAYKADPSVVITQCCKIRQFFNLRFRNGYWGAAIFRATGMTSYEFRRIGGEL